MFAFPAAKRALLLLMSSLFLIAASQALAADKSDKAGYLGVMLQDVSPSMAKALQMGDETGVLINQVVEDSPAAKAGLQDGDVIVAFEGKSLDDYADLTKAVGAHKPGTEVTLTVLREGKKKDIKVELGERDEDLSWVLSGPEGDIDTAKLHKMLKNEGDTWVFNEDGDFEFPEGRHGNVYVKKFGDDDEDVDLYFVGEDRGYLGVHLGDLNEQLGEYFGVKGGKGALVTEVVEDSPAATAGLKAGDVITKLDGDEITGPGDIHEFMAGTEKDQKVTVGFMRKGKFGKAEVTLAEAPVTEFSDQIKIMTDRAHNMHFTGPNKVKIRKLPEPERHIEVIREMEHSDQEIQEMRSEIEKMRQELDQMRQELKK